jgi:hypothetical protein
VTGNREYFTLVFKGDIGKFKLNPLNTETVFGRPEAAGRGDAFEECENLREENERLRKALSFYADGRRYQGANQRPISDDPFAKPDAVYILDVTRDNGSIATAALASEDRQ